MQNADKPHILVIDDDVRILSLVSKYLSKEGFVVLRAENSEEGKEVIKNFELDLIVCDVMMPGENGFEFTKKLREYNSKIPLILLTALGEIENRIEGLETGADDYLSKPFDPRELVLRIKSLLKRTPRISTSKSVYLGSYQVNLEENFLESDKERVTLTEIEGRLLSALIKNSNHPVTRERLAELCDMTGTERAIDVQVTRLRKKLEVDPSQPKYLKTVRGKGYMLRCH